MADSGSEQGVIGINERVTVKAPRKRNKNPGARVIHGRFYSPDGKTCHQCRQKTLDFVAFCTNVRNGEKCTMKVCYKCLLNRYGENAEEVVALGNWCCPRCRGICNCSACMIKKGCKPTGLLAKTSKAKGFSSVSEMLSKGVEHLNGEGVCAPAEKGKDKRKTKRKELEDMHENKESSSRASKKSKKIKMSNTTNDDVPNDENMTVREQDCAEDANMETDSSILDYRKEHLYNDFPLPDGSELQTVCGIDVRAEHVGNALQFIEFCAAFGEILEVKKGHPELILQELLHGKTGRRGKLSLTIQFHIDMLSILQTDLGEEDSTQKEAWFLTLKEYLSESQSVLTQNGLDCLEKIDDYETLDASQKLALLNVLCDEVLGTAKLRNWIDEQTEKHAEKVKDAKKEVLARKGEEKSLKKKMRDDIATAVIACHNGAMTVLQHDAIVSRRKAEVEVAHARVLESKGIVLKNSQTSDAVRTEPFYMADCGKAYWKLNCLGKSDVLHQDIGQGDSLSLAEKWFAIDHEGKDAVDKHISVLKKEALSELQEETMVVAMLYLQGATNSDREEGAGAFELAARQYLVNEVKKTVEGRAQLGVEAFANALLVIPKTLAENSGLDTQDAIIKLTGEHDKGNIVGLNIHTGEAIDPQMEGIFDNYSVKRQIINSGPVITSQLLLVNEVIRAGRNMRKPA